MKWGGLAVLLFGDLFHWQHFRGLLMLLAPVVESMRACEPGLQALSNLAGSKIKNAYIFWLIEFFSKLRYHKFFTGSKIFSFES